MRTYFQKLDLGINDDIGEAIDNQIWKLHDEMHEKALLDRLGSEEQRNKALEWNNKTFQENAKMLKKEINAAIDATTERYSDMTASFPSYKYNARPRSEKTFDEIEEDKNKLSHWIIMAIISIINSFTLLLVILMLFLTK